MFGGDMGRLYKKQAVANAMDFKHSHFTGFSPPTSAQSIVSKAIPGVFLGHINATCQHTW